MKKWIQIWYSWGDVESPVEVPDGQDPWEFMKKLVIDEVAVSQEEYPFGCGIWMFPDDGMIKLKYYQDNECCNYLITGKEIFDPEAYEGEGV